MYIKPIRVGNIEIENNIWLAPMAGITDLSFRKVCKKYGNPGLVFTEMISSKGLFYKDKITEQLLNTEGEKKPIAIQIFGSDANIMADVAKQISNKADIIDINMGCPAPKVVKNGDGSKLLLNLNLIEEIVTKVVQNVNIPVSVKIRKGWDKENIVAVETAKIIERAGASLITIHGRTREEYYSGKVDLEIIKQVKKALNIPVIGNGDIKTKEDAIKMLEYTGVDGIMLGRAVLGNPWIIKNIQNGLENKIEEVINEQEKLEVIKEHLNLLIQEKGEYIAIREMRKHICWYIKNLKNSSEVREKINKIETKQELENCLDEYLKTI